MQDKYDLKGRCPAMVLAEIADPDSQKGINFCTEHCPYEYCVVFEKMVTSVQITTKSRKLKAIILREHQVSVDDIVLILGVSRQTVMNYLSNKKGTEL